MAIPVLGYWDIRGLAEPIRLMLEYAGVKFEDKRYVCGDGPTYDRSEWLNVKPKMDLDFPNLPYFLDGDVKLVESFAIMKYIARKHNVLVPVKDQHLCDMMEGVVSDFRKSFTNLCYSSQYEALVEKYFEDMATKLEKFENYLLKHEWLGGDDLTYVDFAFAEILNQMVMMRPSLLDKHKKVGDYLKKFDSLKPIAAYRSSDRFRRFPCNNKMAKWGGQHEK